MLYWSFPDETEFVTFFDGVYDDVKGTRWEMKSATCTDAETQGLVKYERGCDVRVLPRHAQDLGLGAVGRA